jgi:hypothetical protein
MGHKTVLVVGDNFRDQLDKYQRAEYASPTNRHFVPCDYLEEAKQEFAASYVSFLQDVNGSLHDPCDAQFFRPLNGEKQQYVRAKARMSFLDWVKKVNGYGILSEHEARDVEGKHKLGWTRVNAIGEVIEMFAADIPGGFFDWFESTDDILKLKPGAYGVVIDRNDEEVVANGFAGSARKAAIDFDAMREVMSTFAAERWDRAASVAGSQTWESFKVIWKKYENEKWSHELHLAAVREWAAQPPVNAIIDDCRIFPSSVIRLSSPPATRIIETCCIDEADWKNLNVLERSASDLVWNDHSASGIDPLALPRDQYVQRFGLRQLLGYGTVINDGILLGEHDEIELFNSIADETVITLASVHC